MEKVMIEQSKLVKGKNTFTNTEINSSAVRGSRKFLKKPSDLARSEFLESIYSDDSQEVVPVKVKSIRKSSFGGQILDTATLSNDVLPWIIKSLSVPAEVMGIKINDKNSKYLLLTLYDLSEQAEKIDIDVLFSPPIGIGRDQGFFHYVFYSNEYSSIYTLMVYAVYLDYFTDISHSDLTELFNALKADRALINKMYLAVIGIRGFNIDIGYISKEIFGKEENNLSSINKWLDSKLHRGRSDFILNDVSKQLGSELDFLYHADLLNVRLSASRKKKVKISSRTMAICYCYHLSLKSPLESWTEGRISFYQLTDKRKATLLSFFKRLSNFDSAKEEIYLSESRDSTIKLFKESWEHSSAVRELQFRKELEVASLEDEEIKVFLLSPSKKTDDYLDIHFNSETHKIVKDKYKHDTTILNFLLEHTEILNNREAIRLLEDDRRKFIQFYYYVFLDYYKRWLSQGGSGLPAIFSDNDVQQVISIKKIENSGYYN
jgi:hypothetical protein